MSWYRKNSTKIADLRSTLKDTEKTPGLTQFLNSMGFDENGEELKFPEIDMTPERKKKTEEWDEAEHEHGPA